MPVKKAVMRESKILFPPITSIITKQIIIIDLHYMESFNIILTAIYYQNVLKLNFIKTRIQSSQ